MLHLECFQTQAQLRYGKAGLLPVQDVSSGPSELFFSTFMRHAKTNSAHRMPWDNRPVRSPFLICCSAHTALLYMKCTGSLWSTSQAWSLHACQVHKCRVGTWVSTMGICLCTSMVSRSNESFLAGKYFHTWEVICQIACHIATGLVAMIPFPE
jgi:hypothetical protein